MSTVHPEDSDVDSLRRALTENLRLLNGLSERERLAPAVRYVEDLIVMQSHALLLLETELNSWGDLPLGRVSRGDEKTVIGVEIVGGAVLTVAAYGSWLSGVGWIRAISVALGVVALLCVLMVMQELVSRWWWKSHGAVVEAELERLRVKRALLAGQPDRLT